MGRREFIMLRIHSHFSLPCNASALSPYLSDVIIIISCLVCSIELQNLAKPKSIESLNVVLLNIPPDVWLYIVDDLLPSLNFYVRIKCNRRIHELMY